MTEFIYEITEEDAGMRIDRYLSLKPDLPSRSYLQKLIEDLSVKVDNRPVKANYRLQKGNIILVEIPEPKELEVVAQKMDLDIVYEDSDLLIVNKPKGMVVHPGAGHMTGTIVNALLYHCKASLSGINGVLRPGIVHRIDKDTSGVIVACKNDIAHRCVAAQLAEHSVKRRYYAIANGCLEGEGTIEGAIARSKNNRLKMCIDPSGKSAFTHYQVLAANDKYSYICCRLETGRTHQIRVHMDHIKHPLMGDTVYGNIPCKYHTDGQVLHAAVLGLTHPTSGEYIEFEAPLPDYFSKILVCEDLTT